MFDKNFIVPDPVDVTVTEWFPLPPPPDECVLLRCKDVDCYFGAEAYIDFDGNALAPNMKDKFEEEYDAWAFLPYHFVSELYKRASDTEQTL